MVEENAQAVVTTEQTTQENKANVESELAKAKADLEAARHEAIAEKQNVSKKERQLQEVRNQQTKIDGLEKRLEVVTQMLADLVDRGDVEDEPQPKRKRSDDYLNRIPKEEPKKPELPEEFVKAASEADTLAKSVGLNVEDSDELAKAYRYFMRGKGDEGLAEVKKVVEEKRKVNEPPKKKTVDELTDAEREEIARQYLEKKGNLHTDTGKVSSTGRYFTRQQIAQMTVSEYAANKEAIQEAQMAGRIK